MVEPRLAPLSEDEMDDETRALVEGAGMGSPLNIFRTLARHPKLLKRWLVFGAHVLVKSTLSARDRELLILRTGWNCNTEYEWGQHVAIARQVGITDAEIAAVAAGPDAPGWSPHDAALLRAADDLHTTSSLRDETWAALSKTYGEQQLLDLIFTVGQYHTVAMALNACRVPRDDGVGDDVPFPPAPD
jgi:4-carboxymuconolactone decarboxylase